MGFGSRWDFQFFRVLQDGPYVFRLDSVKIVVPISESRRNFQLFFENIFFGFPDLSIPALPDTICLES